MKRDFRIPRLYKTLVALAVVLGPIYWLMLTEDGQRRTDLVLMAILGRPPFDAALESFTDRLTEARLREGFPALELQCADGPNPFGDRVCAAPIGSFNQYPARAVTLYFRGGQLSAVKVIYQPSYHGRIRGWAERRAGQAPQLPAQAEPGSYPTPPVGGGVAGFPVADGILVLKDGVLDKADEPALLWLSRAALKSTACPADN